MVASILPRALLLVTVSASLLFVGKILQWENPVALVTRLQLEVSGRLARVRLGGSLRFRRRRFAPIVIAGRLLCH